MSLRRIGVLLRKELIWGPKSFLFIMALVVPVVLTLVIQLLVGSFFSGKPALGVADEGQSGFVALVAEIDGLDLRTYESADELLTAVRGGAVDMGLVLPAGFDQQLVGDTAVSLTVYVYGESLLRDRAFLATALVNQLRSLDGQESPITIVTETLGDGQSVPWEERLLPLVVMMAVLMGGLMVPAASLVEEKQKRTITAVTTAAVTLEEIFMAKGIFGASLSLVMGISFLSSTRRSAPSLCCWWACWRWGPSWPPPWGCCWAHSSKTSTPCLPRSRASGHLALRTGLHLPLPHHTGMGRPNFPHLLHDQPHRRSNTKWGGLGRYSPGCRHPRPAQSGSHRGCGLYRPPGAGASGHAARRGRVDDDCPAPTRPSRTDL
jgi:hypothetical protein